MLEDVQYESEEENEEEAEDNQVVIQDSMSDKNWHQYILSSHSI